MNRNEAIALFKSFGAGCETRCYGGSEVLGIQLRKSAVTDCDLTLLEYLRDEVDVVGLEGTNVSDSGLAHLLKLKFLNNVDLTDTAITDKGLETLSQISTLQYIHIEGTGASIAGVRKLQAALPKCEIVSDYDLDESGDPLSD